MKIMYKKIILGLLCVAVLSMFVGGTVQSEDIGMDDIMHIEPQSNAPIFGELGDLYFDLEDKDLCIYNGSVWRGAITGVVCS